MILASDLHFGAHGQDAVLELRRAVQADPDRLLVLAGDLTQDHKPEEYEAARAFLAGLMGAGSSVVCTPGNHDYGRWQGELRANRTARGLYADLLLAQILEQDGIVAHRDADLVFRHGAHLFVALRSTHAHVTRPRRIDSEQVAWAVGVLQTLERRDAHLHLVTHVGLWDGERHAPQAGRRRLEMQLLQPFAFCSVIHGHNHEWLSRRVPTPKLGLPVRQLSLPTLSNRLRAGSPRGWVAWNWPAEPQLVPA